MNQHVRAGGMQGARDLRADAARAAGDQDDLIAQGKIFLSGAHAAATIPQWLAQRELSRKTTRRSGHCALVARAPTATDRRRRLARVSSDTWIWRCMRRDWATTAAAREKLGPGGDFMTAPEISRLFGACVAVQCAEILPQLKLGP